MKTITILEDVDISKPHNYLKLEGNINLTKNCHLTLTDTNWKTNPEINQSLKQSFKESEWIDTIHFGVDEDASQRYTFLDTTENVLIKTYYGKFINTMHDLDAYFG